MWQWHEDAVACNVRRATSEDVKGLLGDRWFAVVGDSVGRNLFAAFVRLLADEGTVIFSCAAFESLCSVLTCCNITYFESHGRPSNAELNVAGKYPVVKGHQDFEYVLPGRIRASFLWAPYTSNATAQLNEW